MDQRETTKRTDGQGWWNGEEKPGMAALAEQIPRPSVTTSIVSELWWSLGNRESN